jgi:DNA-directed RNA polymerase specialized sigma24 family protein
VAEVSSERESIAKPASYWATVINNLGRDRLRRAQRWRVQGGERADVILEGLPSLAPNGEQVFFVRERLLATARRLVGLSSKQRKAILLRSEGNDYSTIAETLQTSEVNARKLVEMGRHALLASWRRQRTRKTAA